MELCTARAISNLLFHQPPPRIALILRPAFPIHLKQFRSISGQRYTIVSCLGSTTEATTYEAEATTYGASSPEDKTAPTTSPEDTFSEAAAPEETVSEAAAPEETVSEAAAPEETVSEVAATEATTSDIKDEPENDSAIAVEVVEPPPVQKKEDYIYQPDVVPLENDSLQLLKFLEDLNIKFDYENKYSIVALGIGGLIALRIAVAVIGAIDSIPLLPKVLELVGLGYTIWFTTRYLIFEQKREEFVARVKEFKEEVLG